MKEMFIKQNISYIELLYTKYMIVNKEYQKYVSMLLEMRDSIVNINKNQFLRCVKGMSMEKIKAMEHPYPSLIDKIKKYGYDPKQLHHIIRLSSFIERYLIYKIPLKECYIAENRDWLIRIKKGAVPLQEARKMALYYDSRTKKICDSYTSENDEVNYETIDKLNELTTIIMKHSFIQELRQEYETSYMKEFTKLD